MRKTFGKFVLSNFTGVSVPDILCKESSYKRKLTAEMTKLWYVILGEYGTNELDV